MSVANEVPTTDVCDVLEGVVRYGAVSAVSVVARGWIVDSASSGLLPTLCDERGLTQELVDTAQQMISGVRWRLKKTGRGW
jgi:hypothetical protein